MNVNKTETAPHEFVPFDKKQYLVVINLRRSRQGVEQGNDFPSVCQVPACEFPNHKGMGQYLLQIEKLREQSG